MTYFSSKQLICFHSKMDSLYRYCQLYALNLFKHYDCSTSWILLLNKLEKEISLFAMGMHFYSITVDVHHKRGPLSGFDCFLLETLIFGLLPLLSNKTISSWVSSWKFIDWPTRNFVQIFSNSSFIISSIFLPLIDGKIRRFFEFINYSLVVV